MPCYYPMIGVQSFNKNENGKRPVKILKKKDILTGNYNIESYRGGDTILLPCGKCLGCRLEYARQWAIRCVLESKMHNENCFITLTYRDKDLPENKSVSKRDLQLFIKRLRKAIRYKGVLPKFDKAMRIQYYKQWWHPNYTEPKIEKVYRKLKYYACGEYGDKNDRPHYHLCLFGYDFSDKELIYFDKQARFKNKFKTGIDHTLYRSKLLESIWQKGFVTIGEVTFNSAGYVARYIVKKQYGKEEDLEEHYKGRKKEFALMSRRTAIGKEWFEKYRNDFYPKDHYHLEGKRQRPPRYYDKLLETENEVLMEAIKKERRKQNEDKLMTSARLVDIEKCLKLLTKSLQRRV